MTINLSVLLLVAACALTACSQPQLRIVDPVSMQLWTDAEGQPDPLRECQRLTQGGCVVQSVEALAWWQARWQARVAALEEGEGR